MKKLAQSLFVVMVTLTLSGCSLSFYYRYADWFIAWELDDYFDLTSQQDDILDEEIERLVEWHKDVELRRAIAPLTAFRDAVEQNQITQQRVDELMVWMYSLWPALAVEVTPSATRLFSTLSDEQIDHLVKRWEEDEQEEKEKDEAKQRKKGISNAKDNVEDWVDYLTDEQEALIEKRYDQIVAFEKEYEDYYLRWLEVFYDTLREQRTNPAEMSARFLMLFTDQAEIRGPEIQAKYEAREVLRNQHIYGLLSTLEADQRKYLVKRINKYLRQMKKILKKVDRKKAKAAKAA